ncbi:MAG: zinc-binding alcohol dehydrogenase [Candidatus Bathyarchaeia archaeon]
MPKEAIAISPGRVVIREYEEPPLRPKDVRVKSLLSAEKHGTTLAILRGISPMNEKGFDSRRLIFLPSETPSTIFPMHLGNMTVGKVTEVGKEVSRLKVGDRVYGYLPMRETHTVSEERLSIAPPFMKDEEIVCIDPAVVALMAVREGGVRIGEIVGVFGLGAIGLMAIQMARISGAVKVLGIEPIDGRRKLAKEYGADDLINPRETDAGLECREKTEGKGVDIAIETSGAYEALHHAIRGTRYGGVIVPVSWYHGEAKGLFLGEEWHFNRQVMVAGARVESEPYRDYPRWDRQRIYKTVIELFRRKVLRTDGIVSPIMSFEEVVEAYKLILESPEASIKLGIRYY